MYRIIALVGPAGSGKNTVADMLCEFNPSLQQVSFAKRLKEACSYSFVMPYASFDNQYLKEQSFHSPQKITPDNLLSVFKHFNVPQELAQEYILPRKNYIDSITVNSPREIMQVIGTNILRDYASNIHCDTLLNSIVSDCVITDCRFLNELETLNTRFPDALTIYINRDEAEEKAKVSTHSSETSILALKSKCKVVIDNNGSLEDLINIVRQL